MILMVDPKDEKWLDGLKNNDRDQMTQCLELPAEEREKWIARKLVDFHSATSERAQDSEKIARYGIVIGTLAVGYAAFSNRNFATAWTLYVLAFLILSIYWWGPRFARFVDWMKKWFSRRCKNL